MKHRLLLNGFSECNTCVKCGICFKYGIQSHRCSKEPCVQQGIHSSDENKSAIERRELAHSGGFKCDCSISCFVNSIKGYLTRHELNQSGERKFRCNLCSYATKHKGYLKVHELNHSTERKFKCSLCSYAVCVHMQLTKKEISKFTS